MIMPCDRHRISLMKITLQKYIEFGFPSDIEIIVPTRTINNINEIIEDPPIPMMLVKYDNGGPYFNPAKAFNLGVIQTKYDNIIITGPDISPKTNVLQQFSEADTGCYVAQVFDLNEDESVRLSLVNNQFRGNHPGFYFLAIYQKKDIYYINGWDEDFLAGKAYEDNDFGERWVRAGLPFNIREDIQANHLFHLRVDDPRGLIINQRLLHKNRENGVIKPKNGLIKL